MFEGVDAEATDYHLDLSLNVDHPVGFGLGLLKDHPRLASHQSDGSVLLLENVLEGVV